MCPALSLLGVIACVTRESVGHTVWLPMSVGAAGGNGPWGVTIGLGGCLSGLVGLQVKLECRWDSCHVSSGLKHLCQFVRFSLCFGLLIGHVGTSEPVVRARLPLFSALFLTLAS